MKALIIAAGPGLRLKSTKNDLPKPLHPVLGVKLIERIIREASEARIDEFIVVCGYQAKQLCNFLNTLPFKISAVFNPNWQKGNGTSVLCAQNYINEDFILLMADHIFSNSILKELLSKDFNGKTVLAVEQNIKKVFTIDDETKVKIENGYIVDIGRELNSFNGIDCGIFRLTPEIFSALISAQNAGKYNLTDAARILALKRKLHPFSIPDGTVININTKKNLRYAETMLLKSLIKKDDGIITRYINRPISQILTKFLAASPIRPNQISVISFLTCLLSGILFFFTPLVAGILAQFSSIIDSVDGEIARLKFQKSYFGAYLDSMLDRYGDAFIILCITLSQYLRTDSLWIWGLGFFALLGSSLSMASRDRFRALTGKSYPFHLERWLRYIPATRDFRLFIIMIGGITNQLILTLAILAIIVNLKIILRIFFVRKLFSVF